MFYRTKTFLKERLPRPVYESLRLVKNPRDIRSAARFVTKPVGDLTLATRLDLLRRVFATTFTVDCPHSQEEVLTFMDAILELPPSVSGSILEAGCYKGGSTAKFSLAAKLANRRLFVFDSFEGIPDHSEDHATNIYGDQALFPPGSYKGSLDEVRSNVTRHGNVDVCTFVMGWFDDTLPGFHEPLAAVYLDVDLASSTRTCLKHLYPLLQPGGVLFSQDGHLPLVLDVFRDEAFWRDEVACEPPEVLGLGKSKLLRITKR